MNGCIHFWVEAIRFDSSFQSSLVGWQIWLGVNDRKILKTGQWFLWTTSPFSGQAVAYGFQPAIKTICTSLFACSLGSIVVCCLLEASPITLPI